MPRKKPQVPPNAHRDPMKLLTEDVLTIREVAKELPGRPNLCTIWRWTNRGVAGVRLEIVRVGERIFTSRQAVARFLEATQEPTGSFK